MPRATDDGRYVIVPDHAVADPASLASCALETPDGVSSAPACHQLLLRPRSRRVLKISGRHEAIHAFCVTWVASKVHGTAEVRRPEPVRGWRLQVLAKYSRRGRARMSSRQQRQAG